MQRFVARLPDSLAELCLIRVGLQVRRASAWAFARRLRRAIDRASADPSMAGAGLLHSERFAVDWRHFGVLQYWNGFDALDAWARREPHADWWRRAVERSRTRGDFGIYHETFLVPRDALESIYVDCRPVGLAAFGILDEPTGPLTTARDRLGRRSRPTPD